MAAASVPLVTYFAIFDKPVGVLKIARVTMCADSFTIHAESPNAKKQRELWGRFSEAYLIYAGRLAVADPSANLPARLVNTGAVVTPAENFDAVNKIAEKFRSGNTADVIVVIESSISAYAIVLLRFPDAENTHRYYRLPLVPELEVPNVYEMRRDMSLFVHTISKRSCAAKMSAHKRPQMAPPAPAPPSAPVPPTSVPPAPVPPTSVPPAPVPPTSVPPAPVPSAPLSPMTPPVDEPETDEPMITTAMPAPIAQPPTQRPLTLTLAQQRPLTPAPAPLTQQPPTPAPAPAPAQLVQQPLTLAQQPLTLAQQQSPSSQEKFDLITLKEEDLISDAEWESTFAALSSYFARHKMITNVVKNRSDSLAIAMYFKVCGIHKLGLLRPDRVDSLSKIPRWTWRIRAR